MRPLPAGDRKRPSGLPPERLEALAHWDELAPEELRAVTADGEAASGLELLREAEGWLAGPARAEDPCPEAEDLYDYAPGPGARALDELRRGLIQRHVHRCAECRSLVATLASSPPVPLYMGPLEARPTPRHELSELDPFSARNVRRRSAWRHFVPLVSAAAALLVAWVAVEHSRGRPGSFDDPQGLLRGAPSARLLHPRGPLLAPATDGSRLSRRPVFEIVPEAGAESYRVVLREHSGGAFDVGATMLELSGPRPHLVAERSLGPGHYSWEAWAVVDGLDRPLGELEFRVVEDPELADELGRLHGEDAVRFLHERGYKSDARDLARDLPTSAAMREYLSRSPDR